MDIRGFDLILLFILSIVVSMIIGYNIIYIIDKKISSVNINIPPVKIPKPVVTVKINKMAGDNDKYLIDVTKSFIKTDVNTPVKIDGKTPVKTDVNTTANVAGYGSNVEMDIVEPFGNFAAVNFKKK
jgi:hypothetical protein